MEEGGRESCLRLDDEGSFLGAKEGKKKAKNPKTLKRERSERRKRFSVYGGKILSKCVSSTWFRLPPPLTLRRRESGELFGSLSALL
jgi:hypothetical protein